MLDGANHGIYNATPPTLSTGAVNTFQLDQNGNLKVSIVSIMTAISQGLNLNPRIVTAAGSVTLTSTDYTVIIEKTVGAATPVILPTNVLGEAFIVKDGKGDAATNNITLTPLSGTIDGSPTYVINTNYGSVSIVGDGTNWLIIARV